MSLNFGQNLFPARGELLTNFDYFDVAEGIGYNVYYGARGDNGEYIVVPTSTTYSEQLKTILTDQSVATTATRYFELKFDITFNLPRNIKGICLVNVPIGIAAYDNNNYSFDYYCIVKAVHYDGSTETVLATGTSLTASESIQQDGRSYYSFTALLKPNISTLKHFKKGETLRFIVEGWYKCNEGSAQQAHLAIGHDPKNREDKGGDIHGATGVGYIVLANEPNSGGTLSYIPTQMAFHVPYVIDI